MDQEGLERYFLDRLAGMDETGIQAIASVICGDRRFLIYRRKPEILELLTHSGASVVLDENGKKETRQTWTANRLRELRTSPEVLLEIVKNLVDPRNHRFDYQNLKHTLDTLNSVLAVDGIGVEIAGSKVLLQPIELSFPLWPDSQVSFEALSAKGVLRNDKLNTVIQHRLVEAARCRNSQAYLASIVMMSSAIETLLIGFFLEHQVDLAHISGVPKYRDGRFKPPHEWKLFDLINIAHEVRWIHKDIKDFGQVVRDYRNLIHGYEQYERGHVVPDAGTCSICWSVSDAVIEDLRMLSSPTPVDF